tara:strand:- start:2692 stop:2838 length:147 start_codon:yes stop_codon:yes gene_type:complete
MDENSFGNAASETNLLIRGGPQGTLRAQNPALVCQAHEAKRPDQPMGI